MTGRRFWMVVLLLGLLPSLVAVCLGDDASASELISMATPLGNAMSGTQTSTPIITFQQRILPDRASISGDFLY